ncbi:hypothetical protein AU468_11010 [Alkalispirochaeta sphaeroplastigenens]|uniref:HTH gntR-type domain-containing protein n=1 Tax=Alkalispirochaeta sphaeroplastigenens TaxID=1187066 RepID=A0A2S4JHV5_9SPIO|nr:GntR family transcriptional regulator [Alkalispirochaeta sphaeroplastigenens]POQ99134.1 hypothetical protein AU468_11010 [Alkalispirochaeta sphaeroplastigenens]
MDLYSSNENAHISQQTVVAQVMAHLKEVIASGKYRPGDRLPTEKELSEMLGVGRSSVREAIKVFQHLGVVESRAAKGTFLRERAHISSEAIAWALLLGDDDLQDVMELREAIETVCFARLTRELAEGSESAQTVLKALQEQVAVMERAAAGNQVQDLVEADYRFHGHIVRAGGNHLFRALYSSLHAFLSEEIRSSYTEMAELSEAARDHAEIIAVLQSQSPEEACIRHREHFERTRRLLKLTV